METNINDIYVKIGFGEISTERGTKLPLGQNFFNEEGDRGNWRAIEINDIPVPVYDLTSELNMGIARTEWLEWLGTNWKEQLVKNTTHFVADFNNLRPFKDTRGIMFASHNDWTNLGENNIPKSDPNHRRPLTDWLGKHMIAQENNPHLSILDFLDQEVNNVTFQTVTPGFELIINEITAIPEDDPFGATLNGITERVKITLPEGEVVYAYGPLYARDCICYVIPDVANRFVRVDSKEEN